MPQPKKQSTMQTTIMIADMRIDSMMRVGRFPPDWNPSMTPQMTPPIAPPTKAITGETPSFIGFGIKNRIVVAESSVSNAGDNKMHKNNRQRNFTGGNFCGGSAFDDKSSLQNGHQAAP